MAALAWLFGILGVVVVDVLCGAGCTSDPVESEYQRPRAYIVSLLGPATTESSTSLGKTFHAFWFRALALLVHGWLYSYFWTAGTLIYLLLRRGVDGVPWEVGHDDTDTSAAA